MNFNVYIAVVIGICFVGCSKPAAPNPSAPIIVEPGIGIPGRLEVGSEVKHIKRYNDDVVLKTSWPFDTNWWEKIWKEPWSRGGQVPSVDAVFEASGPGPVHTIRLSSDRTSPINLRFGSNLVPFGTGQKIGRQQVVEFFGEPKDVFESPGSGGPPPGIATNLPTLLTKGRSVSWLYMADETLYFPTNGIIFNLRGGTVDSVQIVTKVVPATTNSARR